MELLTREQWISKYGQDANQVTAGTGIFPVVLLAQAIIESSGRMNGTFYPGQSTLSKQANNYFGIKANSSYKGPFITLPTRENVNGQWITVNAKFRKYNSPRDSFADYVKFLQENPRYTRAGVFTAANDEEQAQRIAAAGYATDPNYFNLIKSVMKSVKRNLPPPSIIATVITALFFLLIYKAQTKK
jgi:flagellum-specific peptidoglycan hydrolase FlgJ